MVTVRIHQLPTWQRSVSSAALAAVALVIVAVGAGSGSLLPGALVLAAVLVALAVRVHRLRVETERFAVGRGGVELQRSGGGRVPVHAFPAVAGLTRTAELRLDLAAEGLERARRRRADADRSVDLRTDSPRSVDVRSDGDRTDAPRSS